MADREPVIWKLHYRHSISGPEMMDVNILENMQLFSIFLLQKTLEILFCWFHSSGPSV
jgi:hypothetical protein